MIIQYRKNILFYILILTDLKLTGLNNNNIVLEVLLFRYLLYNKTHAGINEVIISISEDQYNLINLYQQLFNKYNILCTQEEKESSYTDNSNNRLNQIISFLQKSKIYPETFTITPETHSIIKIPDSFMINPGVSFIVKIPRKIFEEINDFLLFLEGSTLGFSELYSRNNFFLVQFMSEIYKPSREENYYTTKFNNYSQGEILSSISKAFSRKYITIRKHEEYWGVVNIEYWIDINIKQKKVAFLNSTTNNPQDNCIIYISNLAEFFNKHYNYNEKVIIIDFFQNYPEYEIIQIYIYNSIDKYEVCYTIVNKAEFSLATGGDFFDYLYENPNVINKLKKYSLEETIKIFKLQQTAHILKEKQFFLLLLMVILLVILLMIIFYIIYNILSNQNKLHNISYTSEEQI